MTAARAPRIAGLLASAALFLSCGDGGPSGPPPGILPGADRLLLVVNRASGTLTYLDRRSAATHETAPLGIDLHGFVIDPVRRVGFLAQEARARLLVVDLVTGDTTSSIAFPDFRQPHALALAPDRSRLYVSFPRNDEVGVVDPSTGTLLQAVGVQGTRPEELALSRDGRTLYVANIGAPGTVSVIDTGTLTVTDTAAVGASPEGLGLDPAERVLVVPNAGDATVSILAIPSLDRLALLPTGIDPRRVAFSLDGTRAFVTNLVSDTITVLDLTTLSVRGELPTADGPGPILTDPETGELFVGGTVSNDVVVHEPDGTLARRTLVGLRPERFALWDR